MCQLIGLCKLIYVIVFEFCLQRAIIAKLQIRAIPGNMMVDFIPASSDRTGSSCFILIEVYIYFVYSFIMLSSTVLYTVHSFVLIDVLVYV